LQNYRIKELLFMGEYTRLGDLHVYKISLELCDLGWIIYETLAWRIKKIMGDQFIEATDSNAANIAEGYGRYHILDRIKFYYNARASLYEAKHWCFLLRRRKKITEEQYKKFLQKAEHVHISLNQFISTTRKLKEAER
jgi:four helix bundle protein